MKNWHIIRDKKGNLFASALPTIENRNCIIQDKNNRYDIAKYFVEKEYDEEGNEYIYNHWIDQDGNIFFSNIIRWKYLEE